MYGRITELMSSQATVANIGSDLDQLSSTEQELSTGLKINEPSDDPYGASVVVQLDSQISQLTNYSNNIADGNGWLGAAGGALTDINNAAETARELVVEAANGTESSTDDQDAEDEINQLIGEIKQSANTTYNGSYIFSGTATSTAPYETGTDDTYQGNSGTITRTVGSGTSVQVNSNIGTLLGSGTGANNGAGDGGLLDTLRTIASDLASGNTSALGSTDLTNLDNNLSSLQEMQANVGSLTDRLTDASSAVTTMQTSDQTELANTQDVNMAQAETTYTTEQASYSAALQAGAQIVQESLLNFLSSSS